MWSVMICAGTGTTAAGNRRGRGVSGGVRTVHDSNLKIPCQTGAVGCVRTRGNGDGEMGPEVRRVRGKLDDMREVTAEESKGRFLYFEWLRL